MTTCACGLPATCIADLSGWGLYVRAPVCGPACDVVRASALCCDVVVAPGELLGVIRARVCWCSMIRPFGRGGGRHVTWCPRHGQIDLVDGMCS